MIESLLIAVGLIVLVIFFRCKQKQATTAMSNLKHH